MVCLMLMDIKRNQFRGTQYQKLFNGIAIYIRKLVKWIYKYVWLPPTQIKALMLAIIFCFSWCFLWAHFSLFCCWQIILYICHMKTTIYQNSHSIPYIRLLCIISSMEQILQIQCHIHFYLAHGKYFQIFFWSTIDSL